MKTAKEVWNRFWFEKQDAAPLGIFRIAFAILLIVNALSMLPDLGTWFGTHSMVPLELRLRALGLPGFSLLNWFPDQDLGVRVVFAVYAVACVALLLGVASRAAAAVLYLTLLSFHSSNSLIINSGDFLMQLAALYLIFVDSGAAFSLRNPNPLKHRVFVNPMGWRLIQIQTSVVYVATWIQKMNGPDWLNGTATYYTARIEAYWKYKMPFVFEHLFLIKLSTWGTLAVELALGTLIWFPRLRLWVILAGVFLHLGIEFTMHIHLFEWMMVVLLMSFLKPEDLAFVATAWKRARRGKPGPKRARHTSAS